MKALFVLIYGILGVLSIQTASAYPESDGNNDSDIVMSCRIDSRDVALSVRLDDGIATYRYGPVNGKPELSLAKHIADLDYRRRSGPGNTIDEIITFFSGPYAYQISLGFRTGLQPDPTELKEFGELRVLRNDKEISSFSCTPKTINRTYDLLLDHMRKIGRKETSDGNILPNYSTARSDTASKSAPCERSNNVDTCWSRGITASRSGDLSGALEHYDMSCAADLQTAGCYEAGKLYLQNRKLRNYDRAYERFSSVCESDYPGQGPYACKYLGWMHHTGIGASRDDKRAWKYFAQSCFLHNKYLMIDGEGCHFLAESELRRKRENGGERETKLIAYLALSMGCSDRAQGICNEAKTLLKAERKRSAKWIQLCDNQLKGHPLFDKCADLSVPDRPYEQNEPLRRLLRTLFTDAVEYPERLI